VSGRRNAAFASAVFVGLVLGVATAPTARAEVIYELTPMAAVGATTNATATTVPVGDAIASLGNIARMRIMLARSSYMLAYRLVWSRFIERGSDFLINELTATTGFNLTQHLDLSFTAVALLSSTARIDFADPTTVIPQSSVAGSQAFLSTTVGQSLLYVPTPRWRILQTLGANRVHYLTSVPGATMLPTVTAMSGSLRADLNADRNGYFLELRVTDMYVDGVPPMTTAALAGGHTFFGYTAIGWRRELSPVWFTSIQAGPSFLLRSGNLTISQPAAAASVLYRRDTWFATLTASHAPAANLFSGLATYNDALVLRAAVPLSRNEGFILAGFGSVIYAQMVDANGNLSRLYDQQSVGASLSSRILRSSFYGTLSYSFTHQNGSTAIAGAPGAVPDLNRQTAMLGVIGYFGWGGVAAPAFGGGAMQPALGTGTP
jgi:hypothetical protein